MVGDTTTTTTATTTIPQPAPYQHHVYKGSAHYTPMASAANTPVNLSPTSPRSTSHLAMYGQHPPQIRRPKNPIYVPAALRKTEVPARQSPPKGDAGLDTAAGTWRPGLNGGPFAGDGASTISLITTEDLNSIYGDAPMSPVSGPITRNHWQPDGSTNVCTASACQAPFSFFNRRHHCRKCGGIFCAQHSQRQVRLNEHALFHPEGELQRACDRCYTQYRQWEQMRNSRQNSESSGSTAAVQIGTPIAANPPENNRVGSIANSFSGAWHWSTF
ncbi:FYVE-domain-containing protein [Westerdykella ornata]|uniref:FYVE-domain-containing protein n=1 Tax=Westerdykella ornata TaxID=318751 RepID=A0A6A6J663_WESOR|nr:FYVE-domain-containing protein [Westerdykella ornata]KAF2271882.1 FYVE-domain-containing protein [Westerdykella ornata]